MTSSGAYVGNGTLAKEERYEWRQNTSRGEVGWVRVEDIHVDSRYQREATDSQVLKIAKTWNWVACAAIILARRSDGTLWAIDGQHRVLAAQRRSDTRELPCIIFNVEEVAEEARHFREINTIRKAVSSIDNFNAAIVEGEKSAIAVKQMVEQSGYVVSRSSSNFTVQCVRAIQTEMVRDDALCREVWKLCVDICNGECVKDRVFQSLCEVERRLRKRGDQQSIFDSHNRRKLIEAGQSVLKEECHKAAEYHKKGGAAVWAKGIVKFLNQSRSTRRIDDI